MSLLYKYFERDIASVPEEKMKQIMTGTFRDEDALLFSEKDKLFDEGYLPGEFGVFHLPSGGLSVANLTKMPGVTPEMFDWWFAWHGLDPMRYVIWDKDDHYYFIWQKFYQSCMRSSRISLRCFKSFKSS